jgi:hypothetical protein
MAAEALRSFRLLSHSIVPKQHFLTVDLTVKLARALSIIPANTTVRRRPMYRRRLLDKASNSLEL